MATDTSLNANARCAKAIRVNAGLTQIGLHKRTRLSIPVISRIENSQNVMFDKIQTYAWGCDADTAHLVAAMERGAGVRKAGALVRRHHGWSRK